MDALVKFDYDKQQDDEISLRSGDVLVNVRQVEEGWCEGTLNGVKGMFPDNFVELRPAGSLSKPAPAAPAPRVEPAASTKKERRAKVAFSYIASGDDELTLNPGEIVVVLDEVEEGWWKGLLDGKEGVFPSNFVEEIEEEAPTKPTTTTSQTQLKTQEPPADSRRSASMVNVMPGRIGVDPNELRLKLKSVNTPTTTSEPPARPPVPVAEKTPPPPAQALPPSSSSSGLKKAKVIFLYDAENPDEVSVKEGDIVEVLQFEDETGQEGWWMVKCANGKQGLVPDNFVELIQNAPASVPDNKPIAPQPQKPPPPQIDKAMPNLPPKVPKSSSEPEATKAPPVGGVRLMPTGGLPVKSKSAVPLPTMPPKNDPPPPVAKIEPPRPDPPKSNEPDSGDLDIPRSDILDNKKMKDRPKMNARRPPSRGSLHGGDDNETESPPSSAAPAAAPPSKSSPAMARAPWQQEMMERKKKPGPPPLKQKPKPKPAAKPTPTVDKEEEPKKTFTPTPITAVPPPTHTPSSHTHPPPPANVVKPTPPASKVTATKPDQRPAEDTSGEWKEAFEKLREEFNAFRKQIREEMNDLTDDLDQERKKRAEMEIDIARLRRQRH